MTATIEAAPDQLDQFHWEPQPRACRLVGGLVEAFLAACPSAARLADRMKRETGTRFVDWIDHIQIEHSAEVPARLAEVGFSLDPRPEAPECFVHRGGIFPAIVLSDEALLRVGLKVDSAADFAAALGVDAPIEGEPLSQLRRVRTFVGDNAELWAYERHGYRGFRMPPADPMRARLMLIHLEAFRRRRRDFDSEAAGLAYLNTLVDAAIADIGRDWACDVFFAAERDYWQRRNTAARVQKARQDRLGLGWANHDHHTYRSSRGHFAELIAIWEKFGFTPRERFYAGAQAGWGAQVMEHEATGITTFNDVDMSPEELLGDFAHAPMPERESLGTVGLWCALHGEAILQAGMHHLECQFDWHALKEQLDAEARIKTMDPFTTFPYLRQAFTEGERWPVAEKRIARLLAAGRITEAQADKFRRYGAIGSHLENLERNDGFKGFNQEGVSDIIARTDPRRQHALEGA